MIINTNGITLFYETSGNGKPLILLHGNGEDHHIFDELAEKLADNFNLYAVDSRDHGQSQKTEDLSYSTMTEDIYQFIKKLDLEQVDIVGFSDGAIIGLMLAMEHSELIDKMVLMGINLKPEDFTEESYEYVKETYEETKDPLFKMMLEQPNINLEDVHNIHVPTLLIAGEDDIFKPESFYNLAEALPNAELKIMSGHDHASYIMNQDILYSEFVHFFHS